MTKFQIGGGAKLVCLFSTKFFLEVPLVYVSSRKIFGYHTPTDIFCTEREKTQKFKFCHFGRICDLFPHHFEH